MQIASCGCCIMHSPTRYASLCAYLIGAGMRNVLYVLKLITYVLKWYTILCFYIPASCSTSGSNHMPTFAEYLVLSRCRLRSQCSLLKRQFLGLLFEKQGNNRNVRLAWPCCRRQCYRVGWKFFYPFYRKTICTGATIANVLREKINFVNMSYQIKGIKRKPSLGDWFWGVWSGEGIKN